MRQTAELDSVSVTVMMEQEPGSGGKESAEASIRNLAGFTVRAKTSSGDKAGRAEPLASQAEAGNVKLVRGDWNADFLDEITTFPYGKFKDQVDAAASAFVELAATKPRPTLQVRVTPSYQPKVNY
jgi:predicted phage terminase large subunit-like protein